MGALLAGNGESSSFLQKKNQKTLAIMALKLPQAAR
jgi:hypothetical protein